ncbi:YoaK family protein [Solimicrobium silvestre]|uniref:Putative membrane protein n=1 Tax=Solimicrobium silvestre TaxID=2099400 RepID=A0A2S9GYI1_9BURK|nr:YoaK family protein [Solimicrobium silvestre]PRC92716.1 putative membrane protein [Solimicrobium silvestre]
MPITYLAHLTSPQRTAKSNLHLGVTLAFVAGALNAGGFLAIGQYTSHMSGIVSSAADNLALGNIVLTLSALFSLFAFICGSASTALLVNYAKRHSVIYIYTPTLILEALLLLVFGLIGKKLQQHELVQVSLTAILLCYVMGLQNALITKISNAEIRTTHITGLVTDIGIELGKLIYWNRDQQQPVHGEVLANRDKLKIYCSLVLFFFCGGVFGALGFKNLGFISTVPLAIVLIALSVAPAFTHKE